MLHIFNAKDAKQTGRSLERFMGRLGVELKLGQALDALGVMSGFENWAGLSDSLSEASVNARLSPEMRRHIRENSDNEYGEEYAVVAHTGFELRYDAVEETPSYIRICDPLGREIAYWVSDEWKEDPELVMGAILGALVQGAPVLPGKRKRLAAPVAVKTRVRKNLPTIQDVPFDSVSSVSINDVWFAVTYTDSQVLGMLQAPAEDTGSEEDVYHTAVEMGENGTALSLRDLWDMSWNPGLRCFVDSEGKRYQFNIARSFADYFEAQPAVSARNGESVVTVENTVYRVFEAAYGDNAKTKTSFAWIAARSESEALERLFVGEPTPALVELRVLSDFEAGPFRVIIDGGEYTEVPTLEQAISTADVMESEAESEIEVLDKDGHVIWYFHAHNK